VTSIGSEAALHSLFIYSAHTELVGTVSFPEMHWRTRQRKMCGWADAKMSGMMDGRGWLDNSCVNRWKLSKWMDGYKYGWRRGLKGEYDTL
jgi:hypothetical protein